jgi:hypothetical protein
MQRVYVLGAGASRFAGFPLARDLLGFLKGEWADTRDCMVKELGRYALDFIETVKPALPGTRVFHGEPDLEFVLSLTDEESPLGSEYDSLIDDLQSVTNAIDLTAWDLTKVRLGFTTLVESAFLQKSHQLLTVSPGPAAEDFVAISAAWVERIRPGDTLITFNWDLLQEILLAERKRWSYEDGYGMRTTPEKPLHPSSTSILKLHGSCNWALSHQQDEGLWMEDTHFFGVLNHDAPAVASLGSTSHYGTSLIVPSYLKDPSRVRVLQRIWRLAEDVLSKAETLVVIGYSLPDADVLARRLFGRTIQYSQTLRSITLVLGTDDESFRRWEVLLGERAHERDRRRFEQWVMNERRT